MIIFIWGLPGSGKSTVGKEVAKRTKLEYLEMDDYLPQSFKDKMKSGELISDKERDDFFSLFTQILKNKSRSDLVVSGYVAKKEHRDLLKSISNLTFFELQVDEETLKNRLRNRGDHFFKEETLQKVLKNYEPMTDSVKIDAKKNVEEVVSNILKH